jgi:hypothetical protein
MVISGYGDQWLIEEGCTFSSTGVLLPTKNTGDHLASFRAANCGTLDSDAVRRLLPRYGFVYNPPSEIPRVSTVNGGGGGGREGEGGGGGGRAFMNVHRVEGLALASNSVI